ncbi:MAG: RtcB family protein [Methanomassiliicoccales archaeon]
MRTSTIVYADQEMLTSIRQDNALEQAANIACMPGIVGKALAMPDIHWGYGFPIGGVVAESEDGVISPGGLGFDINCGVRMVRTNLTVTEVRPKIKDLMETLFKLIPCGVGSEGSIKARGNEIDTVLEEGARWAVENGHGWEEDLEVTEEKGEYSAADASKVSQKAKQRGRNQIGTLGAGNHFLEVDRVEHIFEKDVAGRFGIDGEDQIVVTVHCGSRGLGHQVATDYLKVMEEKMRDYDFSLPDRQLACAPLNSKEGRDYFAAMAAAANFGWANRQLILDGIRRSFEIVFGRSAEELGMRMVYDVAHNIAKKEEYEIEGSKITAYIHRKGATRALPAGHPLVPPKYREVGQPVIIPGDMGSASYLLVGDTGSVRESFGSTCHGAGRVLSRSAATRKYTEKEVRRKLEERGIYLKSATVEGVLEEAPGAYKNVDDVVRITHQAGLSRRVARLVPVGVMKG